MKPTLQAELSGGITDITVENDDIYPSFAQPGIESFLAACFLNSKRTKTWTAVAQAEKHSQEVHLYSPLEKIIDVTLRYFQAEDGEQCWVEDTLKAYMDHIEGSHDVEEVTPSGEKKTVTLKSSPDLSNFGHGSHLSGNHSKPGKPAYKHCLCPVEIKTKSNYNEETIVLQAGIYAGQCFIHQPHRRYVPVMIIVGSDLYLYIYDRAGVLRTGAIDIHKSPDTFVRIILGVSTVGTDVRHSPFDPRVRFGYQSEQPTIFLNGNRAVDPVTKYNVTTVKFSRKNIRGRGTYCVTAVEDGGITVLIKEAWRTIDRTPEYDLRQEIKELPGVGQILDYEDDQSTIQDFRRHIFPTFCATDPFELDRRFCRLVLKAYGRSICHFSNKLELLQAFHDAIAGHKYLWKQGILHRDVSVDNILLGEPGAPEGYRGILIDFDLAVKVDIIDDQEGENGKVGDAEDDSKDQGKECEEEELEEGVEIDLAPEQEDDKFDPRGRFRTETRAFQSCTVLQCLDWPNPPPHDHLDDLESYLYCLGWICIKYGGSSVKSPDDLLMGWEDAHDLTCASHKFLFLNNPLIHLPRYFNTAIMHRLLQGLADLCSGWAKRKMSTAPTGKKFPSLSEIHKNISQGQDHDNVLELFQTAIIECFCFTAVLLFSVMCVMLLTKM